MEGMHLHRFLRRLNLLHQANSLTKIPRNLAICSLKPTNGIALVRQCMVHHRDMEHLRLHPLDLAGLHLLDLAELHLLDLADLCHQCHTCHRCPHLLIGDIHLLRRRPRQHLRRHRLLQRSHLLRFRLRRCHRPLLLVLKDLLELLVSLAPSVLSGLSERLVLQVL